ncbi:SCP-like extracellular [Catenulispora acidiphila DSM 44928]|uniref:SCP-like extracellular n=1 Tax=Catenulispora acidiphila (strain DSM 44928 / JCM 14897 / NBRC 102108 / NRRL B-24433 / ID139908) TaxID=479433 RepID=C7QGY3_CATAD|nr:SCP-like extracellular [Catenulispora acidiphila DSM 44928]
MVAGLAITAPLMTLRAHDEDTVALGPDTPNSSVPTSAGPPSAATPPNAAAKAPALVPSPDPAATTGSRSLPPVSRDATRTPTSALPTRTASTAGSGAPTVQISSDEATSYEAEVVALTNDQRAAHGCPALRDDSRLRAAAVGHSVDMQARDYFDHNTPDGVTPWTRIGAQGYSDPSAENIAKGQPTPQAVVEAWMNSAGHRANILNCSSKAIGVGVQFGPGGPWWTQDFGYS